MCVPFWVRLEQLEHDGGTVIGSTVRCILHANFFLPVFSLASNFKACLILFISTSKRNLFLRTYMDLRYTFSYTVCVHVYIICSMRSSNLRHPSMDLLKVWIPKLSADTRIEQPHSWITHAFKAPPCTSSTTVCTGDMINKTNKKHVLYILPAVKESPEGILFFGPRRLGITETSQTNERKEPSFLPSLRQLILHTSKHYDIIISCWSSM